ncbi:glycosyltransferase family 2 protein, partial [Flavobacteriales bacterium]|nr:glycosyltransferase family 2 protein [Flavobacteriales bacterium]
FSNSWISNMVNKFSSSDINLISGPVAYHLEDSIFGNMQSLEFLSLVGSGASCIGLNKPIFCNAANMAYRRDVFLEVNDYKKNNVFSGDDVFLLHQIKNKYKGSTLFLKSFESIVYTTPQSNVKDFINQRIRWASKSNSYKDFDSIIVALLVFLTNLSLVMLLLLSPFSFLDFEYFILFFLVKLFCDYIYLKPILVFFEKNELIKLIFPLQIIYPFYITLITVLSNLFSFNWKGRIQKK